MEYNNFIPPSSGAKTVSRKVTIGPKERLPQNVTLQKDGDVINAIEIRCSCGEIIVIQCNYE